MPTVLIVEDSEGAAEALARLIRRAGFQADRAATGEGALAYLRQLTPDLVVCDLMMPNLDGLGVLRAVRADPRTAHLPVLVYSAAGEAARQPALEAGATAFCVKGSLDPEQLIAQIAALIDRHHAGVLKEEVSHGDTEAQRPTRLQTHPGSADETCSILLE